MHETALILALLNANGVESLPTAKVFAHSSAAARKAKPHELEFAGRCPSGQHLVSKQKDQHCVPNSKPAQKYKTPPGGMKAKHKAVSKKQL
jgi:hypothetical protein